MARIRSMHPGFFKDESYLACSIPARLFAIGLWTEADDQGVFEWKPITLKVCILPADAIDIGALLGELQRRNIVRQFNHAGRTYGAIRNFKRYQRPKKARYYNPLPDDLAEYVKGDNSSVPGGDKFSIDGEPEDNELGLKMPEVRKPNGTAGEKPPQRDLGEGSRREDIPPQGIANPPRTHEAVELCKKYQELIEKHWGNERELPPHAATQTQKALTLLATGAPMDLILAEIDRNLETKRRNGEKPPNWLNYYVDGVKSAIANRTRAAAVGLIPAKPNGGRYGDGSDMVEAAKREFNSRDLKIEAKLKMCREDGCDWQSDWPPLNQVNPILLDQYADVVKRLTGRGA